MEYKKSNHVKQTLNRARPYLPYIHQVFRERNLPSELAYLPMLESSFNPQAVSRTGAKGMWQFKKATAIDNGLTIRWNIDDRLNWRKSTEAAANYLAKLGKRFNYNWELALAGYNGGPTYISKTIKQQHT
ncbi:MAG: lytic transglycosylase domain-containing protein, partial [Proteobacteria bacterium]|nr:lytic transglycosylase domain-containing protein [Pseudomonadota bacterium]